MAAQVMELVCQVTELIRAPETSSWAEPAKETVFVDPEPFNGELDKCHGFLLQCNVIFQQHLHTFESSDYFCFIGLLQGKALIWAKTLNANLDFSTLTSRISF